MPQVFISYSRQDVYFVDYLASSFVKCRISFWQDQKRIKPGHNWQSAILKALEECSVIVLVISPSSLKSDMVEFEWQSAQSAGKPIIPLLLKPASLPHELQALQYIEDFSKLAGFDSGFDKLVRALQDFGVESDCEIGRFGAIDKARFDIRFVEDLSDHVLGLVSSLKAVFTPECKQLLKMIRNTHNYSTKKIEWLSLINGGVVHYGFFESILHHFHVIESILNSSYYPVYSNTGNHFQSFFEYYDKLRMSRWVTVTYEDEVTLPKVIDIEPIDETLLSSLIVEMNRSIQKMKQRGNAEIALPPLLAQIIHTKIAEVIPDIQGVACMANYSEEYSEPYTLYRVHCGWVRVDWKDYPNQTDVVMVEKKIQRMLKTQFKYITRF